MGKAELVSVLMEAGKYGRGVYAGDHERAPVTEKVRKSWSNPE